MGFYAGMGVAAVVLILLIAVLSAYVLIKKRKEKRYKDNREALVQQWLDEDFEWHSQPRSQTSRSVHNPAHMSTNFYSQQDNPVYSSQTFSSQDNMSNIPLQYLPRIHSVRDSTTSTGHERAHIH